MAAILAELSTEERNARPDEAFGLANERAYPMPDERHVRNTTARPAREFTKRNLTSADKVRIDREADIILDAAHSVEEHGDSRASLADQAPMRDLLAPIRIDPLQI